MGGRMEMQKFCLTWKDFNNVFNREFNELRETGDFFDVTLACEDGQIPAHKLVLSAASDLFKEILRRNCHEHPLIFLYGVRAVDIQSILDFIYTGETEVAEDSLELLLATGGNLRIKGLTESSDQEVDVEEQEKKREQGKEGKPWERVVGKVEEEQFPLVAEDFDHQVDLESSPEQASPINVSRFLSTTTKSPPLGPWPSPRGPKRPGRKLGHQRALVQGNNENENELNRQVAELMVSSYDPVLGKTIWQCAQCHYSSKLRYTVKEHVETHISGFCHQCPLCAKTCKTRNALRVHTIRKHNQKAGDSPPKMGLEPQVTKVTKDEVEEGVDPVSQAGQLVGQLGQGLMNHPMLGHPILSSGFMSMMGHTMGRPSLQRQGLLQQE